MTNKKKSKLIKKIIEQIDGADPYFKLLKEAEDSKEAYQTIDYAEMIILETTNLLRKLSIEYYTDM